MSIIALSQPVFTCSESTMEAPELVKSVSSELTVKTPERDH